MYVQRSAATDGSFIGHRTFRSLGMLPTEAVKVPRLFPFRGCSWLRNKP